MSTDTESLASPRHLVRVGFYADKLFAFAQRRGLPTYDLDTGYAVHCALGELFGAASPKPFSVPPEGAAHRGRVLAVLGYSTATAAELRDRASLGADPLVEQMVDWETFASKPVFDRWTLGQRVGFEARVCPVVRTLREHEHHAKGKEVDAFLVACRQVAPDVTVDRATVYRAWFERQLAQHPGAALRSFDMVGFTLERPSRHHHAENKRARLKGRPDARLRGELEVIDVDAFRALVARGVGRHRAFGFGMLLLRPPT